MSRCVAVVLFWRCVDCCYGCGWAGVGVAARLGLGQDCRIRVSLVLSCFVLCCVEGECCHPDALCCHVSRVSIVSLSRVSGVFVSRGLVLSSCCIGACVVCCLVLLG